MTSHPAGNALEQALHSFEDTVDGRRAVLEKFMVARVFVLLDQPWDGKSLPSTEMHLLFVSDGENQEQPMLAVFTDRAKAEETAPAMGEYRHPVEVDAGWALLGVPPNVGVRINPNAAPSFRILPELAVELRKIAEAQLRQRQSAAGAGR